MKRLFFGLVLVLAGIAPSLAADRFTLEYASAGPTIAHADSTRFGVDASLGEAVAGLASSQRFACRAGAVELFAPQTIGPVIKLPLKIELLSDAIVVTWPATNSSSVLQYASSLAPGATWTPLSAPPSVVGGEYFAVLDRTQNARFFRLGAR